MKRLILLLSILFTILLAIGLYYQQQSKQLPINESIFSFVSSSTPIVLQLTLDDRLVETFENADNQAYLFTAAYLQEIKTCYRLAKNNQAIKDVIYNNNLLIAFQPQTADHIAATYILDVSNRPLENIAGFIPSNDSLAKAPAPSEFVDTKIYHARIQADSILHYAKVGNYLIFSFQEQEVQQAIRAHLGIANFQKKQAFVNLFNRYNSKMRGIATIYINYQNLPKFVNTFIKENYFSTFTDFKQLGNFGVFSLDFSKDDWLLKGKLNYDAKNFISVFEGQQASSSYLISFVPNASMGFQDFILSDYSLFRTKLKKYYGNPFATIKTSIFERTINMSEDKISIRFSRFEKTRQVNCKYFRKHSYSMGVSMNLKTGNIVIYRGDKKLMKIRQNSFIFLEEVLRDFLKETKGCAHDFYISMGGGIDSRLTDKINNPF